MAERPWNDFYERYARLFYTNITSYVIQNVIDECFRNKEKQFSDREENWL